MRPGSRGIDRWRRLASALLVVAMACAGASSSAQGASTPGKVILPRNGLVAEDLALLINDDDPASREIGAYYQKVRRIPSANVIHVRFPPGRTTLGKDEFLALKARVDQATPAQVQAFAVAWTTPYRVGCMSITSALAFGFDERFCSTTCGPTAASPYFDSRSVQPASDHKIRPAMLLAGNSFANAKAMIDRGVASDHSFPAGRAYLLSTPDKPRNVRSALFPEAAERLKNVFRIEVLNSEAIANRHDVMFYFTGLSQVPALDTLTFLPGALADHLTSAGGQLTDSSQMSILRWLEAGATASYGTVVEPCNHAQKFPLPGVAMFHYARGGSAIEAYWKSVAWPGEGVFVGEPLASPFAPTIREIGPGEFDLRVFSPSEGRVWLEGAASPVGPYKIAQPPRRLRQGANKLVFRVPPDAGGYLRLRW